MRHLTALSCLLAVSLAIGATGRLQAAVAGSPADSASADSGVVQLPEKLTRQEVRDLLSTLSDDQVRELLIRELDRNAVDPEGGASGEEADAVEQVLGVVQTARMQLGRALDSWPELAALPERIWSQATQAGVVSSWRIVIGLVLMFAAAWIAESALGRATGIGAKFARDSAPHGFMRRLGTSLIRGVMRSLSLLVFAVVAFVVVAVAVWRDEAAQPLFIMLLSLVLAIRIVAILMDVVLAPHAPGLRLVSLDDGAVRTLRSRLLVVGAFLLVDAVIFKSLDVFGVEAHVQALVELIWASVLVIMLIAMIWEARRPYAAIIRGDNADEIADESGFVNGLAANWHVIATAAVLILFAVALGRVGMQGPGVDYPGIKTFLLLILLPLFDLGLRKAVASIFRPEVDGEKDAGEEKSLLTLAPVGEAEREQKKAARRELQAVVLKNFRIVVGFIAILVALGFWGVEPDRLVRSVAGERVGTAFFDIVITALLAYALWSVVKAAVTYHMGPEEESEEEGAGSGEIGGAGQSRLHTLLPLIRKVIFIALVIMGVLIVLSSLGVNIGPLIAGAGVLGLAIGFGAQALVRDIVSGVFFLLDDAFRMGEYVEIGGVRGVVEGISVRSLRLRHHNGPVHTIPFGEIQHLTNYSRDWAIMKFELRLPFETDIDTVRRIIKNVGKEMEHDEVLAPMMLAPLKSQGVNRMDDSALIIRCKFTAIPGQQFLVRREAFTRIQKAFEENGIHFAPKRVIVEAATPALAVAGAAALETEEAAQAEGAAADDRG